MNTTLNKVTRQSYTKQSYFKIFFSTSQGAHPLRHTLYTHPTGAEVLLVLNLGAPSLKKKLNPPLPFKRKQNSRRETSGAPN